MYQKSLIGSAWEEEVQGASRKYYRLSLDLGILPGLGCRIVENPERTKERSPTHLVFFSPIVGQDVKVGAFWPFTNGEGKTYLLGHVDLAAFGEVGLKGGARVDLRLTGERVGVRLSAVHERRSEKSPTHQLWRMRPVAKAAPAETAPAAALEEEDVADLEAAFAHDGLGEEPLEDEA